jgi:ribokinase
MDGVYLTAGDAGAVRAARSARCLVSSARARDALQESGVELDVLVASANDAGELYRAGDLDPRPRLVARTDGARGGSVQGADGTTQRWAAAPLPGPPVDAYGAGDSFAGGLTYGLAEGLPLDDALSLAARCGAACLTGRGPYQGQITRSAAMAPKRSAR